MSHEYLLVGCDTDSIMISKSDELAFTKEERQNLLDEINTILPEYIKFADDGYYPSVLYLKAKNYVLKTEDGKIKYKGSALKSSTLETGFRDFLEECISLILDDKQSEVLNVYNKYVVLLCNIQTKEQMKLFSSKKTLTSKIYESDRANETKVLDAIKGMEYSPGDKVWVFFKQDDSLSVVENFTGDYNVVKLLEKLYKVIQRFETIMDMTPYLNYKLKKNKKALEELL